MPVLHPPQERLYKVKVCLVGEFAVGKTSLVNRYVHDAFQDRYFATIGAKITKTELELRGKKPTRVSMTIWDIMGEKGFRELLKEAYFEGAQGALAVCDLTRPDTLEDLDGWLSALERIAGSVPVVIVANKADLEEQIKLQEEEIATFAKERSSPYEVTSAKTGENVQKAFEKLARLVVRG